MRVFGLIFFGTVLGAAGLFAADSPEPSQAQIDEIIQKFAAKGAEFAKARENYTYHQTARIQELDPWNRQRPLGDRVRYRFRWRRQAQ